MARQVGYQSKTLNCLIIFNILLTKKRFIFAFQNIKMTKGIIAIAFAIIFVSLSVMPSILTLVDDTYDISILISSVEEEEKKGEEKVKNFEIEVPLKETIEDNNYSNSLVKLLNLHLDNYSSFCKELTSPPPEINI